MEKAVVIEQKDSTVEMNEIKPDDVDSKSMVQQNEDVIHAKETETTTTIDPNLKFSPQNGINMGDVNEDKPVDEAAAFVTNLIDKAGEIAVEVHDSIEKKGLVEYVKELSYKGIAAISKAFLGDNAEPSTKEQVVNEHREEELD